MTKKILSLFLSVLVLVAFMAGWSWARNQYESTPMKTVDPYTGKIVDYAVKRYGSHPLRWGDNPTPEDAADQAANPPVSTRVSLGSAAAPTNSMSSPGMILYSTYMDDQYRSPGKRMVDFRGKRPDIHFVYSRTTDPLESSRFGYNVYDPVLGSWPRGLGVGCVIQNTGESGQHAIMDVNSRGLVAIVGSDDVGQTAGTVENHEYYQPAKQSCSFGGGTTIDQSQYNQYFMNKTLPNTLGEPAIEIQEWAGDTITHLLAKEQFMTIQPGGKLSTDEAGDFGLYTINYFRKVGSGTAGTWTGPFCIDTINNISNGNGTHNGSIAASRVSPKVAVAWVHWKKDSPLPWGSVNLRYDNDIWYRVSDSVGLAWGPRTNLTNYSRINKSYTAFLSTNALYDHQGFLHIIWDGGETVPDVYNHPEYFWGDFSTNLFHWSNRTNQIAKAHNAQWGIDVNTQTCGFGSPGTGYIGFYTMSECEGRIYVVYSQYLNYFLDDKDAVPGQKQLDDCASGGWTDKRYAANGELYMVVSQDLDGILWDAARNITKTYTPKCDSVGYGGICMNDTRASLSRFGMNINSYDTNGIPVVLKWPGTDLVDETRSGVDTGGNYIMMMYTEDHFPAPGYRTRNSSTQAMGKLTLNPLKFVRLACVDPVPAPRIFTDTTRIGYPAFTHHGVAKTVTVTVTNEGNATLNISKIQGVKTTQLAKNWLTTTTLATVPAGIPNTGTFDIVLNAGGVINSPGTVVDLSGLVYIKSDAKAPRDSIEIAIDRFLVADTVAVQKWDTVLTSCTKLMVSNNGDMGRDGYGHVGLDYSTAAGGDCDSAYQYNQRYLYDGGPVVVREVTPGSAYSWSNTLFQIGFDTRESFKPVASTPPPGSFTGTGFDAYRTGTFVNRDSLIGIQTNYYAPTPSADSCNFVIVQRKFFPYKGTTVSHVTLGEQIDWDVPSDEAAKNRSRILGGYTVYMRGLDTGVVPDCGTQYDSARFGGAAVLGLYTQTELGSKPCANTQTPYGIYSENQTPLYLQDSITDGNVEGAYFWTAMKNHTGLTAYPNDTDMRIISTYYQDHSFASGTDTAFVVTAVASVKKGVAADLDAAFKKAFVWYNKHLRPTCNLGVLGSCCIAGSADGKTGNIDCDPGKGVDISDLSTLIDNLYISFTPLCCESAANTDGQPGIDISDLSALIDFLYISFTPMANCQ